MEKLHCCSLHEPGEGLFLVDLVANIVDEGGELVLGMIVNNVTDVREDYILEYAVLQVFQEPVESNSKGSSSSHKSSLRSLFHPFLCCFSPLADLSDLQDVGEESFPVHDDYCFLQFPAVQKVFSQDPQGSKVRSLGRQNLKHTLSVKKKE